MSPAMLFWDIGKNIVQIPLFYIVFSIGQFFITLQPDISNCYGDWIKMKHIEVMRKWGKKIGIEIFNKWLISLIMSHIWTVLESGSNA